MNAEHHRTETPFTKVNIDMINSFPIDYMHQILLGVMKRLLLIFLRGPRTVKISQRHIAEMNGRMHSLRNSIPNCFARKPRSFDEFDRWKATELRQFLLYTGIIVLKGIITDEQYQHFLVLNVAIKLFLGKRKSESCYTYVHELLKYFVLKSQELYGNQILVYNVHSLLHLTKEAETYGSLDNCSAFLFESYMQQIKRSVRSGSHVLSQIVKRMQEQSQMPITARKVAELKLVRQSNTFLLDDGSFAEVVNYVTEENGDEKLRCRVYSRRRSSPLFVTPCDSRAVGVAVCKDIDVTMKTVDRDNLERIAIMVHNPEIRKDTFMSVVHETAR